jgi:protein N-terminal amidase
MKIACLQFATTVGDLENNIRKADTVLAEKPPGPLDLLVLPELALTGYDFPDLAAIQPFLESTASGTSTKWALDTARRLNCLVTVGYPEVAVPIALLPPNVSSSTVFAADHAGLIKAGSNYNSAVTVAPNGEIVAHYRKSFLYEADERWAQEGTGFHAGVLPLPWSATERETKITMGICMDINPYKCK